MKIAFVAYDRPNKISGPLVNALRLLPSLQSRGYEVLAIIGYVHEAPHANILKQSGVSVATYERQYTEHDVKKILALTQRFSPDVFVSNISAPAGYAGYWIKKAGIPTIITHRSDDAINWCNAQTFGILATKWQSSAIVCVSKFLKKETIQRSKQPLEIATIPSGVPIPKAIANQEVAQLSIVYSGRFVNKQKRIWDVIHAFEYLGKLHPNLKFTLLGEGSERQKIKSYLQEHGLSKTIVIKEKLSGEAYHEELLKHQMIMLLSDYEGLPGSIMDGMACGLIPIVTNFNGIDELVKDNITGYVVSNRDQALYDTVDKLIKNTALRISISEAAKTHVSNLYSIEKATDYWEELFKKLQQNTSEKKEIRIPFLLHLPSIPQCYRGLDQDIRYIQYLKSQTNKKTKGFLKKINKFFEKIYRHTVN